MSLEKYFGYPKELVDVFKKKGIKIGDYVEVAVKSKLFKGILMPRYALDKKPIIVLKLDNGYNIGIRYSSDIVIKKIEKREKRVSIDEFSSLALYKPSIRNTEKTILIIGTGGTIASKIEYETGAVKPAMSSEEILEAVPEINSIANIESIEVFNLLSENMTPKHWEALAEKIYQSIRKRKYNGIIIAHGTDTMAYTASAIAFAVQELPIPIVFVGAQRSSDRPSSDAALNLLSAVIAAAEADIAESVVVMHGTISDSFSLVHRGVKVRKMHTSRRDAFQSINTLPLAKIYPLEKKIIYLSRNFRRRTETDPILRNRFEEKVALIKYYPGMNPQILEYIVDLGYKGIVIEGTGLGHVGEHLIPVLKKASKNGVIIVMTSQCIFGRVNMNVYLTGRKLQKEAGVIPASDMLPETAYVKLSWLLANYSDIEEVKRLIRINLVGEIEERHIDIFYPRWHHD